MGKGLAGGGEKKREGHWGRGLNATVSALMRVGRQRFDEQAEDEVTEQKLRPPED